MNENRKIFGDRLVEIRQHISLITQTPEKQLSSFAGKLINKYGYEFVAHKLDTIPIGKNKAYIYAALRNEYCKTIDMSEEYVRKLSEVWK